MVTPAGTPGVLDEEEVLSVEGSVSDGEDTVVEVGSASSGDDTTGVSLEGVLVGLNGNGDWSFSEGSLHLGDRVGWDVSESRDGTNTLGFGVSAGSSASRSGGVWVVRLEHEWVSSGDVLESVVHESTIATVVLGGAGNELLLREGFEGSGGNGISTFDGTGGGESPAGTALSLVLDWGNGVSGSPVDGGLEVGFIEFLDVLLLRDLISVKFFHLSIGSVREVVVSESVGLVSRVPGLNLSVSGDEVFFSEHELSNGSVGFSVFRDVGHEFVVLIGESIVSEEFDVRWGFVHEGSSGKGSSGSESSDGGFSVHD